MDAFAKPLCGNDIQNCTIFVQLRPLFCVRSIDRSANPLAQGDTVIHPARGMSPMLQAAAQASDQAPGAGPYRSTRREPRSSAVLTFAVCGLTSSGRFFVELCSTINISRSGCCLRLRTRPQADSALALRAVAGGTSLPAGTSQLLFQVSWMRPDEGGWLIGAFALGEADLCRLAFPSYTP
jgi:hypothetical protein